MCLQETLLHAELRPASDYCAYTSDVTRQDRHERGTAILIHKSIFHRPLPLRTHLQAVAVRVSLGRLYTVCSLYLPHVPVSRQELDTLLAQLPRPFLLLGDMNARSPIWDDPLTTVANDRGRLFEDLLSSDHISLLNDATPTHYHIQTDSYSVIDLSLTTADCVTDFLYSVLPSLYGSDHYPVHLGLVSPSVVNATRPERFQTKKADWPLYKSFTCTDVDPSVFDSVDCFLDRLVDILHTAAQHAMPPTPSTFRAPPVPWWDDSLSDAKRVCLQAERRLRRNGCLAHRIAYKRAKAKLRYLCKCARQNHWREFISSINQHTTLHSIWKKVGKISGKFSASPLPVLRDRLGNMVCDPARVADLLNESYSAVSHSSAYSDDFRRRKQQCESRSLSFRTRRSYSYNAPFSYEELVSALQSARESAPGLDNVPYSLIKRAHPSFLRALLYLYNWVYRDACFPASWGLSVIVPFLKPGKEPTSPSSYRPISLTSCLGKLMEKMVNRRLVWFLERNELICPVQSGFRANRSTTDNLVQLDSAVHAARRSRQHLIGVFFDIQKAYDTAWRYGILSKMFAFGLRGCLPLFVQGFLTNRRICVRVGGVLSSERVLEEGVPQGSVLSCTCFMIAMNDIARNIPQSVHSTLYVDDFAIYAVGADARSIQRRLQVAINGLEEWSQLTGFKFSCEKTVSLHICRKHHCVKLAPHLTLYGRPIPHRDSVRYLGVVFDNSHTWRSHINLLRQRCTKTLDLFKHISHKNWGADRQALLNLYIMLLKPKLEYGMEVVSSAAPTYLQSVYAMQNHAIRIATGAFRSSPVVSIHADSGIKPLSYFIDTKQLNFYFRIHINLSHPLRHLLRLPDAPPASFFGRVSELLLPYGLGLLRLHPETLGDSPPWLPLNCTICTDLFAMRKSLSSRGELKHRFLDHARSHADSLWIYTDGSKTDVGVGYAAITNNVTLTGRLSSFASSFTAELFAIRRAIDYAETTDRLRITIVADSRSSIQAIARLFPRNPIVQAIRQRLLVSHKHYTFCWCPSHVGIRFNTIADSFARFFADHGIVSRSMLPRHDLKSYVKLQSRRLWSDSWFRQPVVNKLRRFKDSTLPFPNSTSDDRHWERTLCRLRIGHTQLTHGFLMDQSTPPLCGDCIVPLTIYHILVECPSFSDDRVIFGMDPSLSDILTRFSDRHGLLRRFLLNINILHLL